MDINNIEYGFYKSDLNDIRNISNSNSIYILRKSEDNKIIYSLKSDSYYDNEFNVGDNIDNSINKFAESVFKGKIIEGKRINKNNENNILLYIYPLYGANKEIISAIGIEFEDTLVFKFFNYVFMIYFPIIIFVLIIFIVCVFMIFNKYINLIIERYIYVDDLTNLKNKTAFEHRINELNKNLNEKTDICILLFEIDNIKSIIDSFGKISGDKCINNISKIINNNFRNIGTSYRVGEKFFAIIFENSTNEVIKKSIKDFKLALSKYNESNNSFFISVDINLGYEFYKYLENENLESVIKNANNKLCEEKEYKKLNYTRTQR